MHIQKNAKIVMWIQIKEQRARTQHLYWFTLPQKLHLVFLANKQRIPLKQVKCTHNTFKTQSCILEK